MTNHRNPRKIVKNTAYLYVRMLIILIIGLYTSRLILQELGITDYGIYNVIGGLITIFSFINTSMTQATQRFITIKVGEENHEELRMIFSTSVYLHLLLAVIIVILGETVGLWYVCNIAVIPPDRFKAAIWVYQCSIIVSCSTIITVPYNALILAHERMSAFSYFSIFEAIMKLGIVGLLIIAHTDKLILYAVMMALLSISMRIIYGIYSKRHFPETRLTKKIDRPYIKSIGKFAGWSLCGCMAAAGYSQGLNLVLNLFFGPTINASRGVAVTAQAVIKNFSTNFQVAVNPQITKSFALNDISYLYQLIFRSSFFSFFLYYLFALPVFLEIDTLLSIWLVDVPQFTNVFIRILLLISSIELLASPLNVSAQATGEIRTYELTTGIILLLIVPISYFLLKIWPIPTIVFLVFLIQTIIAFAVRIILIKKKIGLSYRLYFSNVLFKIFSVGLLASITPIALHQVIHDSILRLICVSIACITFTPCIIFIVGLNKSEKSLVIQEIKQRFMKK